MLLFAISCSDWGGGKLRERASQMGDDSTPFPLCCCCSGDQLHLNPNVAAHFFFVYYRMILPPNYKHLCQIYMNY